MTTAISHPRKSRASVSSSISAPNACARNTTSPVIDRLAIYPPPIFLSVPAPLPIRFASHRQCLHSDPFDVLLLLLLLPLLVIDRFVADRSSRKEKGEGREILWNGIQRVRGNNSTGSINNSSGNDSRIGSTLAEARKWAIEAKVARASIVVMRRGALPLFRNSRLARKAAVVRGADRVSLVADDASFVAAVERNQPQRRGRCSVEGSAVDHHRQHGAACSSRHAVVESGGKRSRSRASSLRHFSVLQRLDPPRIATAGDR